MQERVTSPKPDPAPQHVTFDAIMPAAMAARAEESGVKKAAMDPLTVLILSVLAGAFVAFGAIFATTVSAGSILVTAADGAPAASAALPYGIGRLLIGVAFSERIAVHLRSSGNGKHTTVADHSYPVSIASSQYRSGCRDRSVVPPMNHSLGGVSRRIAFGIGGCASPQPPHLGETLDPPRWTREQAGEILCNPARRNSNR